MEATTTKGKRTKRQRASQPNNLPEFTAPARNSSETIAGASSSSSEFTDGTVSFNGRVTKEEEDMANCLILLATSSSSPTKLAEKDDVVSYECKTCDRVFTSFQALGGHRASHKKLKSNECQNVVTVAAEKKKTTPFRLVDDSGPTTTTLSLRVSTGRGILGILNPKSNNGKVHECSVCGAEFTSGQALGGHMRRHRTTATSSSSLPNQTMATTTSFSTYSPERSEDQNKPKNVLELDLNLPAPEDHRNGRETTKFPFSDQVIVFSATPLVDCHY